MKYKNILDTNSKTHNQSQKVKRFVDNPYVVGDTVAEHISRGVRLISLLSPLLKEEFREKISISKLYSIFIVHDDDEIVLKRDIVTYLKDHNKNDKEEIELIKNFYSTLDSKITKQVVQSFKDFRERTTLESKISKQIDNIISNELVIEQKIGLIAPYMAKFTIEYVKSVRDLSKSEVMRSVIDTQIDDIQKTRNNFLTNKKVLKGVLKKYCRKYDLNNKDLLLKSEELLKIDIENVFIDDKKIDLLIQDYP